MLKKIREYIGRKKLELRTGRTDWRQIVIWITLAIAALIVTGIVALIALVAIISIGLLVVVSLLTPPPTDAQLKPIFGEKAVKS